MFSTIAQMGRVLAAVRRMLLEGKNAEADDQLEHAAQKGGIVLGAETQPRVAEIEDFLRRDKLNAEVPRS